MGEVRSTAESIVDSSLRALVLELLDQAGERLLTFPAAKQMHHAERSGLLHHMTGMLRCAKAIAAVYPWLNGDLLAAGVIVHDLAKLSEMDARYVGRGFRLYGAGQAHRAHRARRGGHRGRREIRSARARTSCCCCSIWCFLTMESRNLEARWRLNFPEAEVLNTIDTLDARLFEMQEALARTSPGGFSEKVWAMDNRQLYRIPD